MGFVDELYIGADEAVYHLFRLSFWTQADVVGSLKEDEAGGMVLAKNVAVEALQGRLAQSAFHHAVAPDAEVEHAYGLLSVERRCQKVGPTVLLVGGAAPSVGDGVAQYGNGGCR